MNRTIIGIVAGALLAAAPNTERLYWADFTVLEMFPPGQ